MLTFLLLVVAAVPMSVQAHSRDEPHLENSSGESVSLSSKRGKPAIVFYEDRGSVDLNRAFKDELFRRGKQTQSLASVHVIAVANVSGYDFFPARNLVQGAVQRTEAKLGLPIWLDFRGTLQAEPWRLPKDTSTVLLLDGEGQIAWRHSGALSAQLQEDIFHKLSELIHAAIAEGTNP